MKASRMIHLAAEDSGKCSPWLGCYILARTFCLRGLPGGLVVKNLPAMQEEVQVTWVPSLGGEDPLEENMATHSSLLP